MLSILTGLALAALTDGVVSMFIVFGAKAVPVMLAIVSAGALAVAVAIAWGK